MSQQEFYSAYNTPGQYSFLDANKAQQKTVALKALGRGCAVKNFRAKVPLNELTTVFVAF